MVVFVCGSCGRSLKKNQVETHSYKCQGFQYMTCMDCSKEFWGNEYVNHTTCITENEKYGGSKYIPKELKGQKKQDEWIVQIQESLSTTKNMNPQLRLMFNHILLFSNIPRKKAKFMNFLRSNNYRNEHLIQEAWTYFEEIQKKSSNTPINTVSKDTVEEVGASNTEAAQAEPKRKSKRERKEERQKKQTKVQKREKRKRELEEEEEDEDATQETEKPMKKKKKKKWREEEEGNQENEEPTVGQEEEDDDAGQGSERKGEASSKRGAFKWKKAINTVLQDAPEEGMKMKKLKRKIFALYMEYKIDAAYRISDNDIEALIFKKLQMRNDKYVMVKDRVKLKNAN